MKRVPLSVPVGFALGLVLLAAASSGRGRSSTAAATEGPSIEEMAARVKALEALLPSQSHLMTDVGEHFANLWFAGRAENWPLADFCLAETRSHLHWAVRRIPIRKDSQGQDIHLEPILEAFENSQLAQLKKAIDDQDGDAFESTYKESLTVCYACHKASDKPYLRLRVPTEPASRILQFDPKADWPR